MLRGTEDHRWTVASALWPGFEIRFATDGERVGVDMGLSSAYHVIRSHEGDFEATSETGKGTQFRVKLPIHPSAIGSAGTRIPQ